MIDGFVLVTEHSGTMWYRRDSQNVDRHPLDQTVRKQTHVGTSAQYEGWDLLRQRHFKYPEAKGTSSCVVFG